MYACAEQLQNKLGIPLLNMSIYVIFISTLCDEMVHAHATGLLESPQLGQHRSIEVVTRRLYLVGKSGVGKTSTVDKLCGRGEYWRSNVFHVFLKI